MSDRATWTQLLRCERCGGPLDQPGALLFSPPLADGAVRKHHVCANCYGQRGEELLTMPAAGSGVPVADPFATVKALPEWRAFTEAHDEATELTTPHEGEPAPAFHRVTEARTNLIHTAHRLARRITTSSPVADPERGA